MMLYKILTFLWLFVGYGYALCSTDEVGNPEYPYKYYSWTTIYQNIAGNVSAEDRPPPECKPVHIVMIARHASRFPGEEFVQFYQDLHNLSQNLNTTGNALLCSEDMKNIQSWINWYDPENKADVSPVGEKEMQDIAQHFADYLPEIFDNAGSQSDKFRFFGTIYDRTNQSAQAFASEIFKNNQSANVHYEIRDRLLRIWPYCQKFIEEIGTNATVNEERTKFNEKYMKKVAENLADNLGIPREKIDLDYIYLFIILGCAFEEWSTGVHSAWCLALSTDDLKAYEYLQDIRSYLTDSYGHELNYEQACELKYFILSALKNASMEQSPSYLGHFGFTHSSAIVQIMTALNVIEDGGILRADDYEVNANRSFRVSFIGPGSGNVAMVLYKCGASEEMKIQTFVNERLVKMPPNDPKELWDLDDALKYYRFDEGMCDFDELCRVDSAEAPTHSGEYPAHELTTTDDESAADKATTADRESTTDEVKTPSHSSTTDGAPESTKVCGVALAIVLATAVFTM